MLTFKKTAKFIACILIIAGTHNAIAGYKIEVDNFSIYSTEDDSLIAHQLAIYVGQCKSKYDRVFKYRYSQSIDIYLARSVEDYEKFNRPNIPEWSSGVAYTKQRKIILKPGSFFDPARYRATLFHEIAHMYISEVSQNGPVPLWFHEGVSMYLSEKEISWQESITMGNALSSGNLVDLAAIDSVLLFLNTKAEIAYLQSFWRFSI